VITCSVLLLATLEHNLINTYRYRLKLEEYVQLCRIYMLSNSCEHRTCSHEAITPNVIAGFIVSNFELQQTIECKSIYMYCYHMKLGAHVPLCHIYMRSNSCENRPYIHRATTSNVMAGYKLSNFELQPTIEHKSVNMYRYCLKLAETISLCFIYWIS
jgi:hypothetical protein